MSTRNNIDWHLRSDGRSERRSQGFSRSFTKRQADDIARAEYRPGLARWSKHAGQSTMLFQRIRLRLGWALA